MLNILYENYLLLVIAAGSLLVFITWFVYYWLRIQWGSREVEAQRKQTKADMADIMLVFQTMRDVVQKQKALARDFNQELEQKTLLVKRILQCKGTESSAKRSIQISTCPSLECPIRERKHKAHESLRLVRWTG